MSFKIRGPLTLSSINACVWIFENNRSNGTKKQNIDIDVANGYIYHSQGSHSDWKTWETWENGKAFASQGKVREFLTDWKSQGKSHKILENSGNLR